jgi:hypothetical protein
MKPHRTISIRKCRCGSHNIAINFYFRAKLEGSPDYLWEKNGFVSKLECTDCGRASMRFQECVENSIKTWNDFNK